MTETVNTVVITGLRIKGSERFMIYPLYAARGHPLRLRRQRAPSLTGALPHGVRLLNADLAPGCDPELTRDHHLLAGRESLVDDDEILLPLPERHGPQCRGGILLHNVDEGAFGCRLQRRLGNQYRSLAHAQDQADPGE